MSTIKEIECLMGLSCNVVIGQSASLQIKELLTEKNTLLGKCKTFTSTLV